MSKRHTDTTLYDQQWFQILHPIYKCFWHYICSRCNHAGIWDVNLPLAQFTIDPKGETGIKFNQLLEVFDGRIIALSDDKWYLKKYVLFHHGKTLTPNNNFHLSIINSLDKYGLVEEDEDGNYAVKEAKGSVLDKPAKRKASVRMKKPTVALCVGYFNEKECPNAEEEAEKFWNFYESKGWMVGKNPMKNWHSAAANWIKGIEKEKNTIKSRAYVQEGHLNEPSDW